MDCSIYLDEISKCSTSGLTEREKIVLIKLIKSTYSRKKISSYFRLKRDKFDFDEGPYLMALIKKGLVERRSGNLLGDGISYDLTTCCLFYIFLNMQNYPNQLLLKYQDNILLKTLLFSYFTTSSVREFYPQLSDSIAQYLRLCCWTSLNLLKTMKDSGTPINWEKLRMVLEYELEWNVKILVIRVTMLTRKWGDKPQENTQTNQYVSSQTNYDKNFFRTLIASDVRFLTLLKFVKNEFIDGYKEISNQRRNYAEPI
jgi:hypothetical protein